jgi:hypothetical protein
MKREQLLELAKAAGFTEEQVEEYIKDKQRKQTKAKQLKVKLKKKRKARIIYGLNTNAM